MKRKHSHGTHLGFLTALLSLHGTHLGFLTALLSLHGPRLGLLTALLVLLAGCAGLITEGYPTLRRKMPRTEIVRLVAPDNKTGYQMHARGPERVKKAFEEALRKRHVAFGSATNDATVVIAVTITGWEYSDDGFTGKGERDGVDLSVRVSDARTGRIRTRADLHARKLEKLIDKYVETLFVNPEDGDDD